MGPFLPEERKDSSSESDEESNVRHDRFKSERFQRDNSSFRPVAKREDRTYYNERGSSRRHRDRSPRSHKYKDSLHSSRDSSKSDHDRKDSERRHQSKSSRSNRISEKSTRDNKLNKVSEYDNNTSSRPSNKNKLSSLLKNFDEQVQSKLSKTNSETATNIGPALPPNLRESMASKDIDSNVSEIEDDMLGPKLPDNFRNKNVSSSLEVEATLPTHLKQKHNTDSNSESEIKSLDTLGIASQSLQTNLQTSEKKGVGEAYIETQGCSKIDHNSIDDSGSMDSTADIVVPQKMETDKHEPVETSKPDVYGPILPPKIEVDSYGPALPPNFKKDVIKGPSLPSEMTLEELESMGQEESEDEDTVGPLPEGKMTVTQYQLELRASQLKRKLEDEKNGSSKDVKKREEWMLELPPEKATNLGLGPRSFRMRAAPDMSNRSSWTDTPADKQRKEEQALRGEVEPMNSEDMSRMAFIKERDEVMDMMSKKSREEDRPQSLLELHQKKLKKKKKKEDKEGKKKERRPFDRNIDLQVNRFDDAQKKAIFKKAQLLDTRFSKGESKYL